jgi:putative ABC transport system permease protein
MGILVLVSHVYSLNLSWRICVASVRTIMQLFLLGLVLYPIFTHDMPLVVLPYILLMISFAVREAAAKPKYKYARMQQHFFQSVFLATGASFMATAFAVVRPNPWWSAQYMIPLCGMMLGNNVNALSLGLDKYLSSLIEGSALLETSLAAGGTASEAALPGMQAALSTGLTPTLNSMNVIGLVSIPGMMTGQVLGGAAPDIAAKYQAMIMFLIAFSSCVALGAALFLATHRALFDHEHRLLHHCIVRREGPKPKDLLVATIAGTVSGGRVVLRTLCGSRCRGRGGKGDGVGLVRAQETPVSGTLDAPRDGFTYFCSQEPEPVDMPDGAGSSPLLQLIDGAVSLPLTESGSSGGIGGSPQVEESAPPTTVFSGVSLSLHRGVPLVVSGPSGSGKSTLLKALARLAPLSSGTLALDGTSVDDVSATAWRRQVCYVRQAGGAGLPGTPQDLIDQLGQLRAQRTKGSGAASAASLSVRRFLEELDLPPSLLMQTWTSLSGGQSQRIYLCVLLALQPTVLLLDEVTSACDPEAAFAVERLVAGCGAPGVCWITHDPEQARRVGRATVRFSRG